MNGQSGVLGVNRGGGGVAVWFGLVSFGLVSLGSDVHDLTHLWDTDTTQSHLMRKGNLVCARCL